MAVGLVLTRAAAPKLLPEEHPQLVVTLVSESSESMSAELSESVPTESPHPDTELVSPVERQEDATSEAFFLTGILPTLDLPSDNPQSVDLGDKPEPPANGQIHAPETNEVALGVNTDNAAFIQTTSLEESPDEISGLGIGIGDSETSYGSNPKPIYPKSARKKGQEGLVIVTVAVDTNGFPEFVKLKQSSGYRILDEAATNTAYHWLFVPAKRNYRAVASTVDVPIRFTLVR
jgi:TonB family protein